tara:strand:+ start:132 stop:491 length:360 start_codon:yes stop_codon:yes gene_type:complete
MKLKYFTYEEFDSPDIPGSGSSMDSNFLELLDRAREFAGISFKINSGLRSKAHNTAIRGKSSSSHLVGKAADIHCADSRSRSIIINALLKAGANRIGVASTFIHVDTDESKSPNVIWTY